MTQGARNISAPFSFFFSCLWIFTDSDIPNCTSASYAAKLIAYGVCFSDGQSLYIPRRPFRWLAPFSHDADRHSAFEDWPTLESLELPVRCFVRGDGHRLWHLVSVAGDARRCIRHLHRR